MPLQAKSEAFGPGERIPEKYTADGQDISPPLSWGKIPEDARELALIVEDPDAPRPEPFVHWLVYKISRDASGLPEGVARGATLQSPPGAVQGKNSFGKIGYGGPAPPSGHGTHHYHFRLYALDEPLEVQPGLDKKALLDAMSRHVIDETDLVGVYQR